MRLLPQSMLGRVYALYAATLIVVATCGLALFLWQQVDKQIHDTRDDAQALLELVGPVVRDSAVIGDYDTITRQLVRVAQHSSIGGARFQDPSGGVLRADGRADRRWAPAWLSVWVLRQVGRPMQTVSAGGTVYGELTFTVAAAAIAGQIWRQTLWALALAVAGVMAGLALIRPPLKRWLGQLDRIGELGRGLEGGQRLAHSALMSDAPVEFRRTFEVLGRAAASLQEQREQAAATLQAIDDAVLACSTDGVVVLANEAAQRLLQRSRAGLVGAAVVELLPALAESHPQGLQGHWQHRQLLWHDRGGQLHVLDANLSPVVDAEGRWLGQVLACRDVTEQHQREGAMRELNAARDSALAALRRALEDVAVPGAQPLAGELADIEAVSTLVSRLVMRLHEHGAQLDAIFALSPDGFVSFDGERRVRYSSPGFSRLTGLAPEMVLGLEEAVFVNRLRSRCDTGLELARMASLFGTEPRESRLQLALKQPLRRVVELALHRGRASAVSQMLHVRDVTRETEVDRMKSEFVAAAAHELRTPMVGIYGYSELLVTRDLPPERAKPLLGRIHRQCEVMVNILNEMLDLTRLEATRGSDFEFAALPLASVVDQALADHCPPPGRDAPQWQAPPTPIAVRADAAKLLRGLRNLLSNAYKYSPAGGDVIVRLTRDIPAGRVGVEIVDHGIGMTPAQLARVGERFYRADASGTVLGTGLGMSLAREIVNLHGGSIDLRSALGQGTTATLWLPVLAQEPAAAAPDEAVSTGLLSAV